MDKIEIIKRINQARIKANLSARALSQNIDLNDGYINRLESKKDFLPSLEVLLKIIKECNLTPEQFFYYDMFEYNKDRTIIEKIKNLNEHQKQALTIILDSMK